MTTYLQSTRDFLYRRRRPFIIIGGLIGGVYVAANYAVTKLSEMQRRMVEERRDRENLRKRFQQNQEDCSYTILALLPTLGDQLFTYMDVEGLTSKLQKGRLSSSGAQTPAEGKQNVVLAPLSQEQSGDKETINEVDQEQAKTNGAPTENVEEKHKEDTELSSDKKVEQNGGLEENGRLEQNNMPASVAAEEQTKSDSSGLTGEASKAELQVDSKYEQVDAETLAREAAQERQAKLALWNELKIAAFARTITSLYGVVLLSLQTHVQLNLLGRYAYLTSVSSLSGNEAQSDSQAASLSSPQSHQIRLERHDQSDPYSNGGGHEGYDSEEEFEKEQNARIAAKDAKEASSTGKSKEHDVMRDGIDVQTERLYLTLSWWFLHRGWRTLADLVQEAVHEVFDDVGLKSSLTHADVTSMLRKVRRRVEYEARSLDASFLSADGVSNATVNGGGGFDGRSELSDANTAHTLRKRGKRRNFVEILFPPPQEEVQVLREAGALTEDDDLATATSMHDLSPLLPVLLDETRDIVESDDFWRIMRLALKSVFDVFEDSLRPSFGLGPALSAQRHASAAATATASIVEVSDEQEAKDFAEEFVGKSVRLASLFPAVARQSSSAIHGMPNEYVDALANVKEVRAFCAIIYSAWS